MFARKDGTPIHPAYVSGRFRLPVERAEVPPVRLHDLRHGVASLAHEAGADVKTLQDLLGHSSIVITADTYTSVLPLAQRKCADATAKLVLVADRRTREKIRGKSRRNRRNQRPAKGMPTPARPTTVNRPCSSTTTCPWAFHVTFDFTCMSTLTRSGRFGPRCWRSWNAPASWRTRPTAASPADPARGPRTSRRIHGHLRCSRDPGAWRCVRMAKPAFAAVCHARVPGPSDGSCGMC
ncbi:hypothetical protein GCM10010170_093660 [Dactylosporangium salmoneum]|uniref:Tyr recombinase domain-containing protein n=1 Tax=Dactylosporangium salmoneum TaxID=53361 RepID=A0ABP5UN43_9ACTN